MASIKYNFRFIAWVFVLAISFSQSYGWNGRGHMVVAAMSYSQLSAGQKQNVTELLKNHPNYQTKWKGEYSKVSGTMDLGTFLMMRASTWPDEIRDSTDPNHGLHRPEWHYVTYEMHFPNSHVTTLPNPKETPNVVWAIENARLMVNDPQLAKKERAIYLAWLIHLIGDIHQPHHCGTLFDSTYKKPNGDVGGNWFFVVANGKQTNLHSLWDGSLGGGIDLTEINQQANNLLASNPPKGIALTYNPRAWSLESFNILVKKVRLNGLLKGSTKKGDGVPLPDSYTGGMAGIAMQRGATGGYRLGKTIQGLKITNVPDADENEE